MTTTTPTLTDRYILVVLRRLPADQRPDVERELRGSIADDIDSRVGGGAEPSAAEREVLTQLGDPDRLAAGYADRPLHLIGPAVFLDWLRLVKLLLAVVVPITTLVVAVTGAIASDATVGGVIGDAIGTAVGVAVHVVFWTTLVFAVIERTPSVRWSQTRRWTPDFLPEPSTYRPTATALVGATLATVSFWTVVLLSPLFRFRTDADGEPIPVLSPWLWDSGVIYVFVAVAVAGLALDYVKHYVRFNAGVAVLAGLVQVANAALVVWVGLEDRVLNPEFAAAAQWPADVTRWVHIGLVIAGSLGIVVPLIQMVVSLVTRSWRPNDLGALSRDAARALTGRPGH